MESDRLIADLVAGFFIALGIFGLLARWGLMNPWAKRVEKTSGSRPEVGQTVGPEEEKVLSIRKDRRNKEVWLAERVRIPAVRGAEESGRGTK